MSVRNVEFELDNKYETVRFWDRHLEIVKKKLIDENLGLKATHVNNIIYYGLVRHGTQTRLMLQVQIPRTGNDKSVLSPPRIRTYNIDGDEKPIRELYGLLTSWK